MENLQVLFKPYTTDSNQPERHTDGAAGYDLCSIHAGIIPPHSMIKMDLGFSLEFPDTIVGILCGRSGFAKNNGINVNSTIVRSGEPVSVVMCNESDLEFRFEKGTRIAQIFFPKLSKLPIEIK